MAETHWSECWRVHLPCALARLSALEADAERLREAATVAVEAWYDNAESVGCAEAMNRLSAALDAARSSTPAEGANA